MSAMLAVPQLRPLTLGEIFDRAVSLYVRSFPLFSMIALVLVVPLAIVQYLAAGSSAEYAQLLDQVQHPRHPASPAAPLNSSAVGWFVLLAMLLALLSPFVWCAVAQAVARLYGGGRADSIDCLRAVFGRWRSLLGAIVLQVMVLGGIFLAGMLGFLLVGAVAAALFTLGAAAAIAAVTVVLVYFLTWILSIALSYLAIQFGFFGAALEERGSADAIAQGFRRIFNRSEFWRAVLLAFSLFAVYVGLSILNLFAALVFTSWLHAPFLQAAVQGVLSLASGSFLAVLLAVYYFDVRVRQEGLDMEAQVARLRARAAT